MVLFGGHERLLARDNAKRIPDFTTSGYYLEEVLGDQSGKADTLAGLGSLYNKMERYEEAVRFYREAAMIYVALKDNAGEGGTRNNSAVSLIALQRYDEARRELERAIECKAPFGYAAEPWITFQILHDLERAVGNDVGAHHGHQQAMIAYLAYRRDGGESRDWGGEVVAFVAKVLAEGEGALAATALVELQNNPQLTQERKPLLQALQQIVSGERDPDLADDPELFYMDAVELRLLLERLQNTTA